MHLNRDEFRSESGIRLLHVNLARGQRMPRRALVLLALLLVGLAGRGGAVVSVTVVDGSASLPEVPPSPGSPAIRHSTSDPVRFSNEGATEPQLVVYSATHSFRYDQDGATSGSSVQHQGVTTPLADNLFVAQSASGAFLPLRVATAADLTGQAGWTKNAGCGTVTYQGQLSIPWFSNAGVAQTPLTRYYQVCDAGAEVYVDQDKDLATGADLAYVTTTQQVLAAEADYEVVVQGVELVFPPAASASAVALQQGRFTPSPITSGGATTLDSYFLYRFPDGFPAGAVTTTLTATATDIMV